jgi:hypothetical protein
VTSPFIAAVNYMIAARRPSLLNFVIADSSAQASRRAAWLRDEEARTVEQQREQQRPRTASDEGNLAGSEDPGKKEPGRTWTAWRHAEPAS